MQRTNSWWGAFVTLASLLVLLALGACSESTVATDAGQRDGGSFDRAVPRVDAAGHDARQADAGGEVASGPSLPDGAVAPVDLCPPDAPQLGQLCGTSGLECEYGSDPDLRCDAVFACAANLWVIGCPAAYDCNAGLSTQGCPFPDSGVQLCSMTNGSVCPASLDGVPEGAGLWGRAGRLRLPRGALRLRLRSRCFGRVRPDGRRPPPERVAVRHRVDAGLSREKAASRLAVQRHRGLRLSGQPAWQRR